MAVNSAASGLCGYQNALQASPQLYDGYQAARLSLALIKDDVGDITILHRLVADSRHLALWIKRLATNP